jgi:hypothetical protein
MFPSQYYALRDRREEEGQRHGNKTVDCHENNNINWMFLATLVTRSNNRWQQQFDVI